MESCLCVLVTVTLLAAAAAPVAAEAEWPGSKNETMCKLLLEKFSESSSNFTLCANQFARPIHMCRECKDDFINVRKYYNALLHSKQDDINCKDIMTSQDKVEVIQETYEFIAGRDGLWSRGHCSLCYTAPLTKDSLLTNDTLAYFALFRSVQDCFDSHPNNSMPNSTTKSEACSECAIDYYNLLKFYKDNFVGKSGQVDGVCFDILDAMNSTQHWWGTGYYHCGRTIRGSAPLISAVVLVLGTLPTFYLMLRFAPGTRTARERVITQTTIEEIIARQQESAQEEVAASPPHPAGFSISDS